MVKLLQHGLWRQDSLHYQHVAHVHASGTVEAKLFQHGQDYLLIDMHTYVCVHVCIHVPFSDVIVAAWMGMCIPLVHF